MRLNLPLGLLASIVLTSPGWSQTPPAQAEPGRKAPSFVNEVEPLLTRLGCNMGACHGKGAGQNGFRLSLRGYAPEWDYNWLTREANGRRINAAVPEASLILHKPTAQVPHAGGLVMKEGSREYQLLCDWIRLGAPGPKKDEPSLCRLEIQKVERVLRPGEEQQLVVQAEYTDGQVKDVTWLTRFASNDASVASVTPAGKVAILRPGETAIRGSFMGQVAVVLLASPHDRPVDPSRFAVKNNFVDELVFKKLAQLHIEPSALSSDETFLRRVYLDTIGIPPTSAEVRAFLADSRADKRARVIDRLLERPEFVDFWTWWLGDLVQNRKESDHDVRGSKGVRSLYHWLRQQVAVNRPWDELARDILTATGTTDENPAIGYYIVNVGEQREAQRSTAVASVAQTFLGTRIGCAQCHNHPLEKYTQDDYYHFAAFFSRLSFERKESKQGPTTLVVSHADKNQNKNPVGVTQPRTGQFLPPQPLDRQAVAVAPGDDPRKALADWITKPGNEQFAGAMVNRLWAHFFHIGLVEPIDDLRASNPPSNPELYSTLVKEFVRSKFDRKEMIRLILNSRTYQLASTTTPGNDKDERFYSRYYARRLPAEVLLDAICQVTGQPETFDGYPVGIRAVQNPDPAVRSYFLGIFGRSERITACACERNNDVTLPQTLHLRVGETISERVNHPDSPVQRLMKEKKTAVEMVDELFLACIGRLPRVEERQAIERHLQGGDEMMRREVLSDVLWALLNAKEFSFNH